MLVAHRVIKIKLFMNKSQSVNQTSVSMTGWEMFFSQSPSVPTDVTLSGEAKTDHHTQQQLGVKAKSQCFSRFTGSKINLCYHQHYDGRRSTFVLQGLADPLRCFHFSSLETSAQVDIGWSCAGNYTRSPG